MTKNRSDSEEPGLKPSIIKALPTGWKDEADAMSESDLRAQIIQAESAMRDAKNEMEADERLQGAKSIVKDLSEPYKEVRKAQNAKIQYALFLLDKKGKL